ncbi:MAG: hypothetical protein EPO00_13405 [Chloroflexota bacterium]|nr:MAG: hypothetical protein EPO00_13405 [Chloroflexota bacterium]
MRNTLQHKFNITLGTLCTIKRFVSTSRDRLYLNLRTLLHLGRTHLKSLDLRFKIFYTSQK